MLFRTCYFCLLGNILEYVPTNNFGLQILVVQIDIALRINHLRVDSSKLVVVGIEESSLSMNFFTIATAATEVFFVVVAGKNSNSSVVADMLAANSCCFGMNFKIEGTYRCSPTMYSFVAA